jgi:hypothetical protein
MMRFATAAAAAVMVAGFANPSAAQGLPRFCNPNVLATNSFYSNVLSNGSTAEVQYHGQFQNQDYERLRTITATMSIVVARFGNWEITRPLTRLTLAPNQQSDVVLMVLRTRNAAGQGAPTAAHVGAQIRFSCAFTAR